MDRPSAGEVGQAILAVVLVIVIFNRLLPFVFFTRTRGLWISKYRILLRVLFYLVMPVTAAGISTFDCGTGGTPRRATMRALRSGGCIDRSR